MPRPQPRPITFSIDGREVEAPENTMLVDAAKIGDVEIPVFCYEPKLGAPVGACRMCLVDIEGIPKLQTACSTPVKDGMVVHTQTPRVKEAQEAIVEFLLVNHPLDCPVCDKGGECPLQDISFGWGGGKSRFIEPKRHFEKPLALSPLIAIDRERCILCYRCVRFSQEISEDYQLVLHDRAASTYVGTFDGHPYVAPFSGNIIELCPVGALTSTPYRFRARPWDIEGGGSVCTLCPGQCNVHFTVRDERVLRVLARDNDEVDDGWLCDRGRFAYQAIHAPERVTSPMIRDGGVLREVSWERALDEAGRALGRMAGKVAGIAGGETTNEEGFLLQRLIREGLAGEDVDSARGIDPSLLHALADPALQATVADLEFAHTVLVLGTEPVDDMAIVDLRIRKGVRRRRMKLAVASARPSSLDPIAERSARFAPGGEAAFTRALAAALFGGDIDAPARDADADADAVRAIADLLRTNGEDVVVLYGEDLLRVGGATFAAALKKIAGGVGIGSRPAGSGAGLLAVPRAANGRGLAEAGVLPGMGPGYAPRERPGRGTDAIAEGLRAGELTAVHLLHVDPLRDFDDHAGWDAALERATTVVAHARFLTEGLAEHATVVFPAESHAEKEGTVTHPDGRLQRLRPSIGRQGETRPTWQVLGELGARIGLDLGVLTGAMATDQLTAAVPFYAGLTLDEIGGRGVRWQEREAASAFPAAPDVAAPDGAPAPAASPNGELRIGTFRSIWASPDVAASPALSFLVPSQRVEMSPADAERLGVGHGENVEVCADDRSVAATVHIRADGPQGSVFLETGLAEDSANRLGTSGSLVAVRSRALVSAGPGDAHEAAARAAAPSGSATVASGDAPDHETAEPADDSPAGLESAPGEQIQGDPPAPSEEDIT